MDDDPIRFVPIGTAPSPLQFMPSFTPFRSPFESASQMQVIGISVPFFPQPPISAPAPVLAPASPSVHVSEPTLFMPKVRLSFKLFTIRGLLCSPLKERALIQNSCFAQNEGVVPFLHIKEERDCTLSFVIGARVFELERATSSSKC